MLLFGELWRFLRLRKKFWLLPLIFINLALEGMLPRGAIATALMPAQV